MTSALTQLAAEEHVNELPADPKIIGAAVFVGLCILLLITLSFKRDR
jgi:hypothetical protein